jgi:hypothetical protein
MNELAIWILAFAAGIGAGSLLRVVWIGIVYAYGPPACWLWKWLSYFFYRSGLQGIARTYKLLIASWVCLLLTGLLAWATYELWETTCSPDFDGTACILGVFILGAGLWSLWNALILYRVGLLILRAIPMPPPGRTPSRFTSS